MSKTKHTPGPWKQKDTPGYNDTDIVAADDLLVAKVRDGDFDASLIAAAPDMLQMLLMCEVYFYRKGKEEMRSLVSNMIAKATGAA